MSRKKTVPELCATIRRLTKRWLAIFPRSLKNPAARRERNQLDRVLGRLESILKHERGRAGRRALAAVRREFKRAFKRETRKRERRGR